MLPFSFRFYFMRFCFLQIIHLTAKTAHHTSDFQNCTISLEKHGYPGGYSINVRATIFDVNYITSVPRPSFTLAGEETTDASWSSGHPLYRNS